MMGGSQQRRQRWRGGMREARLGAAITITVFWSALRQLLLSLSRSLFSGELLLLGGMQQSAIAITSVRALAGADTGPLAGRLHALRSSSSVGLRPRTAARRRSALTYNLKWRST